MTSMALLKTKTTLVRISIKAAMGNAKKLMGIVCPQEKGDIEVHNKILGGEWFQIQILPKLINMKTLLKMYIENIKRL